MRIKRVAISLCTAMCLPPKPPVVKAAPRTLKRGVPLVKKQIGTMHVTEVCAGTMTWGSFVEKEASAHKELDTFVEELCAAVDAIHEQYRSPTTTLANKALLLAAPWVASAEECAAVA